MRRLSLERLEPRLALTLPPSPWPNYYELELIPFFDTFGGQVETVQAYQDSAETRVTFSLYDTGASVVTFSAYDQLLFDLLETPIPVKNRGGAVADAIGGAIVGDVSQPGVVVADGLHAVTIDNQLNIVVDTATAAQVPGVQVFVGTLTGSPNLPTITGTPIHQPSPAHPNGAAALINMAAYRVDFGALFPEVPEFKDIVLYLPDLWFVEPGYRLTAGDDGSTSDPMRLPLAMYGENNYAAPGDQITTTPNPVHRDVDVYKGDYGSLNNTFLFDTGAQLSVISTDVAAELGLDLASPEMTIDVFGAGGTKQVPGFTLDALDLTRDDNADGAIDGLLRYREVPVFVLDVAPGIDGILGTNLFNAAHELVYDPFDPAGPSMSVTFLTHRLDVGLTSEEQAALDYLSNNFPAFAGALGGSGLPGLPLQTGPAWQNPAVPADVNGDGVVSPSDLLVAVNDLLAHGPRELPPYMIWDGGRPNYLDASGDGVFSPLDLLTVINALVAELAVRAPASAAASFPAASAAPSADPWPPQLAAAYDPVAVNAAGEPARPDAAAASRSASQAKDSGGFALPDLAVYLVQSPQPVVFEPAAFDAAFPPARSADPELDAGEAAWMDLIAADLAQSGLLVGPER